jgi:hypothetical protein
MPLTKEQLNSIRKFGCFKFVNPQPENLESQELIQINPIYFLVNSKYQMGYQVLADKYKKWKTSTNEGFRENSKALGSFICDISPWRCVKSFFKTMTDSKSPMDTGRNKRFSLSLRMFSRYKKFCENQKDHWTSFKHGISSRIASYKQRNKDEYDNYISHLDQLDNKLVLIPIGISRTVARLRFYGGRIIKNIFRIAGRTLVSVCEFVWYLVKTIFNVLRFLLSIIVRLVYNVILHIIILILCIICCVLYLVNFLVWPIILICGFSLRTFLRFYYFFMFQLCKLFSGMLPDTIKESDLRDDMYYHNNQGKTFRQLIIINEEMYNQLVQVDNN